MGQSRSTIGACENGGHPEKTGRAAQKIRRCGSRTKTMAIKTYRPITPTLRFKTALVNDDLTTTSRISRC
jgi:hypothetical protein